MGAHYGQGTEVPGVDQAGPALQVSHEDRGPVRVVALCGEADLATRGVLESQLFQALEPPREAIVIDVTLLTFCDVACADLVLGAGMTRGASLVGASGPVLRVFELVRRLEVAPHGARSGW